jgi:hypothetical protein
MDIWLILGVIWLLTSFYNFWMLPEDLKQKTNLASFIIFTLLSPIVTVVVLFNMYVLGKH